MSAAKGSDEQTNPVVTATIEGLLGKRVISAQRVRSGYSATIRWIVQTDAAESFFCKVGTTPASWEMLHHEAWVYERLHLPCMPTVVAWHEDEATPILIPEDLSHAHWPPPWSDDTLGRAFDVIDQIHEVSAPMRSYADRNGPDWNWWDRIERQPEAFLRLQLVTGEWLRSSLPILRESARSVSPVGSTVGHFDLRSDNLCFPGAEAKLFDWSLACLGNPKIDLGLFLPGLFAEHGLRPQEVLPYEPGIASWVAGFFAWYASKPTIPTAPHVRSMQFRHLKAALPWVKSEQGI